MFANGIPANAILVDYSKTWNKSVMRSDSSFHTHKIKLLILSEMDCWTNTLLCISLRTDKFGFCSVYFFILQVEDWQHSMATSLLEWCYIELRHLRELANIVFSFNLEWFKHMEGPRNKACPLDSICLFCFYLILSYLAHQLLPPTTPIATTYDIVWLHIHCMYTYTHTYTHLHTHTHMYML